MRIKFFCFLVLFFVGHTFSTPGNEKTFFTFNDDELMAFEKKIEYKPEKKDSFLKISRINVNGPYYDGILGYNLFIIRGKSNYHLEDVLTLLLRGQFRLFGYDMAKNKLYAYRTFQTSDSFLIKNIAVISIKKTTEKKNPLTEYLHHIPKEPVVEIIGPEGEYQYASCSPDGKYCLLIDNRVTVIDIQKKKVLKKDVGIEISTAAEPMRKGEGGGTIIGGDYNLSGEFLEMRWETNTSGKLICRDKNKKLVEEFIINID